MYCPDKIDMIAFAGLYQFVDVFRLVFRIGESPVRGAVVGVVFGAVDVVGHFVPAVEINE